MALQRVISNFQRTIQIYRYLYIVVVIYNTYMTLWRTTKIPEFYFDEIEKALQISHKYVSVSEFIRKAIEEKLLNFKSNKDFLLVKDLVFNEAKIIQIHNLISSKFNVESNKLLNNNIYKIVEE